MAVHCKTVGLTGSVLYWRVSKKVIHPAQTAELKWLQHALLIAQQRAAVALARTVEKDHEVSMLVRRIKNIQDE